MTICIRRWTTADREKKCVQKWTTEIRILVSSGSGSSEGRMNKLLKRACVCVCVCVCTYVRAYVPQS